jgi:hypothetical protein
MLGGPDWEDCLVGL